MGAGHRRVVWTEAASAAVDEAIARDPGAPPPEACSRLTDAARFRPLHHDARATFDHLRKRFNVPRQEYDARDAGLDAGQRRRRPADRQPSVT
jgi:hypothetical protein